MGNNLRPGRYHPGTGSQQAGEYQAQGNTYATHAHYYKRACGVFNYFSNKGLVYAQNEAIAA